MKHWQTIPIPQLMLDHCERDPRGLPVPFVVLKDKEGKHHFKINDTAKTLACMMNSLCTICGTKMANQEKWLVGGIASAFDPKGYYVDHPVHKCCAIYALQVCPYLAMPNYNGKIDMIKLQEKFKGEAILNNPTVDQDRLPFFVLLRPPLIEYHLKGNDILVVPVRVNMEVEFWNDGMQITELPEVLAKIQNTKWEKYGKDIQKLPGWNVQVA